MIIEKLQYDESCILSFVPAVSVLAGPLALCSPIGDRFSVRVRLRRIGLL
jgi:hypothetical protein